MKGKGSESQINFPALIQIEEAKNMPDLRLRAQTQPDMDGSSGLFLELSTAERLMLFLLLAD